jgi:hypothetical protein
MTRWQDIGKQSDYISSYEFRFGKDLIVTIKDVKEEIITGDGGRKEPCRVARFKEDVKPMILNKKNCKTISKLYNSDEMEKWSNARIQLYFDQSVKFGSETVGGVRVRAFIPEVVSDKCEECKKQVTEHNGASPSVIIKATKNKYGVVLCGECALKRKASESVEVVKDASVQ